MQLIKIELDEFQDTEVTEVKGGQDCESLLSDNERFLSSNIQIIGFFARAISGINL